MKLIGLLILALLCLSVPSIVPILLFIGVLIGVAVKESR